MAKRAIPIILFLLCFSLFITPFSARAASTTEAKEPIRPDQSCNLTIRYRCDGTAMTGMAVKLYRIADVSEDFQYTLSGNFASAGVIVNGIRTTGEWNVIRGTLESYILAGNIGEDAAVATDKEGQACFGDLQPGLYLAYPVQWMQNDTRCLFDSSLIALPGLGEDGLWQYQLTVTAKPAQIPTDPEQPDPYNIVKLWKGEPDPSVRPKSVEVEIFKNGVSYETVTLSEANYWSYTWMPDDPEASWMIAERTIPAGYTPGVEQKG